MSKTLSPKRNDVGVIVARFQVNTLHLAHRTLIETVLANHDRVIIFLGVSPLKNSPNNPIPVNHDDELELRDELELVFLNGELLRDQSFDEIRDLVLR